MKTGFDTEPKDNSTAQQIRENELLTSGEMSNQVGISGGFPHDDTPLFDHIMREKEI